MPLAAGTKLGPYEITSPFGAVLYEMPTGKPTFAGETISDTLAAVIRAEPDWSALPGNVPR
jgi:eukaryotic-like serine/threonine-protein kinase